MGRTKKYTKQRINSLADQFLKWAQKAYKSKEIFWFKDFAISKGFSAQRLSEFGETNDKFSEALKRVKDMQESVLVKTGFNKEFNHGFAIFALKNVAGWRDRQEIGGMIFNGKIDWPKLTVAQIERLRNGEDPLNVLTTEQILQQ